MVINGPGGGIFGWWPCDLVAVARICVYDYSLEGGWGEQATYSLLIKRAF